MSEEISSIPEDAQKESENKEEPAAPKGKEAKEVKPMMPVKPKVDKIQALKDFANLDLQKPVKARMMKRYKQILELSQAKSTKVMHGLQQVWTTVNPDMFISGLRLVTKGGIGTITYHRYETDNKGNKVYQPVYTKIKNSRGDDVEIEVSGSYKHECLVVETIEYMKPLTVKEIKEFL